MDTYSSTSTTISSLYQNIIVLDTYSSTSTTISSLYQNIIVMDTYSSTSTTISSLYQNIIVLDTYCSTSTTISSYYMRTLSSWIHTALHVSGCPFLSFSTGSSIPICTANSLFSSAIIGQG